MSATSRKRRATSRKRRATSRKPCATSRKRRHRHSKKRRYRHSIFEEACNQADAEQARRLEPEEVARLARLSTLEYDRQREEAAKRLRVPSPCVEPERDGASWLVLRDNHGWLHSDRRQALRERDEIDHDERFPWGRYR